MNESTEWEIVENEYKIYKHRINEHGVGEEETIEYKQKWHDENPIIDLEPNPPSDTDIIAGELVKMKLENMQKDKLINTLGEELTKIKLEIMTLKGGV